MPLPPAVTLKTLETTYMSLTGRPRAGGKVTLEYPYTLQDSTGNVVVTKGPIVITLDASGHHSTQVPPTNDPDLTPSGFTVKVIEDFPRLPATQTEAAVPAHYAEFELSIPYDGVDPLSLADVVRDLPPATPTAGVAATQAYVDGLLVAHNANPDPHPGYTTTAEVDDQIAAALVAITDRLDALEASMTTAQSDISTLQSTDSTHGADITALQADVSTVQSTIADVQNALAAAGTLIGGDGSITEIVKKTVAEYNDLKNQGLLSATTLYWRP